MQVFCYNLLHTCQTWNNWFVVEIKYTDSSSKIFFHVICLEEGIFWHYMKAEELYCNDRWESGGQNLLATENVSLNHPPLYISNSIPKANLDW